MTQYPYKSQWTTDASKHRTVLCAPGSPARDIADVSLRHAVLNGKLKMSYAASGVAPSNVGNLGPCEFGSAVSLASQVRLPALAVSVGHVLGVCAEEQMRGVAA